MVLTQLSRDAFRERLFARLYPQLKDRTDIELAVRIYDKKLTMGENRQAMVDEAQGEYVSFIDDDDLVAPDYVEKIYPLLDGVDYVGFRVQTYIDATPLPPTIHSLEHQSWWQDAKGAYRDISHLNPIRRELALQAKHTGGMEHDQRWAAELRAKGIVKTQRYIERAMYFYYYRTTKNDAVVPPLPGPAE